MNKIKLDYSNIMDFIDENNINEKVSCCISAGKKLLDRSGLGSDFLGWVDLPAKISDEEMDEYIKMGDKIRENSDILIVIGIGGSYLGARACISALLPEFDKKSPEILFAGNSLSPIYLNSLLNYIKGKRITVNVISKSGTTTEPALTFRVIRNYMEKIYSKDELKQRIIATTDARKGALKSFADREGFKTFVVPDDVGGRFSVLSPVGLLPIAVAGINVKELIEGAKEGMKEYQNLENPLENPSLMYALLRNLLYERGKTIEILSNFEPHLHYIAEWWKQLYGESEGKQGKGIYPASCDFTTDLHSMGQWIQDGVRNIFETFINIEDTCPAIIIEEDPENLDQLNFLTGKTIGYVNRQALLGTRMAHKEGGVPNMTLSLPTLSPFIMGKLFYFFQWAVGVSGYILDVNPFDQPGVESYKKNMFALLHKPGFEKMTQSLEEKLQKEKIYTVG